MDDRKFAIGVSVGVHLLALAFLVLSFQSEPVRTRASPRMEAVETVAVDEAAVKEELRKLRRSEQSRRDAETDRQRKLADEAEKMRLAREQEAERLAELKQKSEQEKRERKTAEEIERKRIEELKVEQQRLTTKREEETKRVEALEKQRVAEEKRQRAAEEARKKAEAEEALKKKMAAEAQDLAEDSARLNDSLKNDYISLIKNKVERNWLRPSGTAGSVNCKVQVQQMPGGEVTSVRLVQSCGNPALDRSVEAAVRKASPLPKPPTPDVFDREIIFQFTTER